MKAAKKRVGSKSKSDVQLKAELLALAKSGAPRPADNSVLGKALERFTTPPETNVVFCSPTLEVANVMSLINDGNVLTEAAAYRQYLAVIQFINKSSLLPNGCYWPVQTNFILGPEGTLEDDPGFNVNDFEFELELAIYDAVDVAQQEEQAKL